MKKKDMAMKIMIIVILLLLIAVGFLVIKYVLNGNEPAGPVDQLDIDINQADYVENSKVNHSKNIILPGWGEITIQKDTTEIKRGVDFHNPDENVWYSCPDCNDQLDAEFKCMNEDCGHQFTEEEAVVDCYYMTFALYLADGEKLYESGLIAPGKHLQHITLTRALSEGDYDAYVFIQPYKSDRATACNNGKVNITLHVK